MYNKYFNFINVGTLILPGQCLMFTGGTYEQWSVRHSLSNNGSAPGVECLAEMLWPGDQGVTITRHIAHF